MDTREKLIELLKNVYVEMPITTAEYLIAGGVTVQQWIPVTERLPEDKTQVLCCAKSVYGQYRKITYFSSCLEKVDKYDFEGAKHGGFYSYDSEYGYYEVTDVTHWMPLPEQPGGE